MKARTMSWLLLLLAGCAVHIDGEQSERERAAAAGVGYQQAFADRELPALRRDSALTDYLAHAERANGALEASWQRWQAALEQVPQARMQSATAMLGVSQQLDGGSALERTTFQLMNDAMNNLLWPGKLTARGEAALARARVAGAEFFEQRLQLQTEVTERYLMLAERDEDLRLLQRLRTVLTVAVPSVEARVRAGASGQPALLQAQIGIDRVDAELVQLQTERPALVAALRAAVGAGPDFVDASPALPELQPLRQSEQDSIGAALLHNPGLQRRAREAEAALATLRSTEWQRVPDFTLNAMVMGTGIWTLGGAVSLPFLRDGAIDAAVAEAEALLRAAEAMRRQTGSEAVAQTIAGLAGLRAIEQQSAVLRQRLLPRLDQVADLLRAAWTAGTGDFAACSEAMAMAVEVERVLVRIRAAHGLARARLQAALGNALLAR